MISVKVNGVPIEVPKNTWVIDACAKAEVYIPTLCHHPDLPPAGKCGICVVKINGSQYSLSCSTKVTQGMIIETDAPDVKAKALIALNQFSDMPLLPDSKEIEEIYNYLIPKRPKRGRKAEDTFALSFDPVKCVNCGRCERMCSDGQLIGALDESSHSLKENECISCGQCTTVCPTAALKEHNSIPDVLRALASGKVMLFQCAPATRVSLGECFGEEVGTIVTRKIAAAAKIMGFHYVFDTNYAADMTIWEEGTEFIGRVSNNGVLPMFTSCCPAWINFVEKIHPELIPNLSTAKSPHMMMGAALKSYFAEKKKIDPKNMFVVSMMPCTAKKDEIKRGQMIEDVDAVVTVREFAEMIKQFGIDWNSLEGKDFDPVMGESTGAAALFGVTGGVMEAAVRFAHEKLTNDKLGKVEYYQWRGFKNIKSANIQIGGADLKIAVCSGIAAARELIESDEYKNYHFIEVMACPCGCVGGGGQPFVKSRHEITKRADSIYQIDCEKRNSTKVTSNDNSEIVQMYKEYMGEPNHGRAHELLHTTYEQQVTPILEQKKMMEKLPIIAFGSASGNAAKMARTVASYIGTSPVSLNSVGLTKIIKKGVAVIVCSTFGDGEFPSNAQKFYEQLEANTEPLNGLKYAVLALGSNDYPKFCLAGRMIDQMLAKQGAERLMDICEIDGSSPDKGEGTFENWAPSIVGALGLKMPEIKVTSQYNIKLYQNPSDPIYQNPEKPLGFDWGVIFSSTVLTPEGYQPAMHRYQIKIPPNMKYLAGDHVAILPQNDVDTVKATIEELKLNPKDILEVKTELPEGMNTIPNKVTVEQLFFQYLDLNGIPNRTLIRAFKQFCKNTFAKERLEKLLDPSEPRYLNDFMKDTSIGEFILEYSRHGIPPLDILISACPLIKPRLYSIASAPTSTSHYIDLIITDNIFGPQNTRHGLCTLFLRRFGLTKIAIHTQTGCFGYPKDPKTPILMAALGFGVAPMLSLLQHREELDGEIGNAALFFGCRFKNTYPILDSILENYIDTGAMQDLYVAYSREGTSKTYITDLMANNTDDVWRYWQDPKCEYFYCGPARGIPDQLNQILVQVSMDKGNMTRDEAEEFCNRHPHHVESF
ncbi:Iron only hydrogenase large subunit, C-terminal domain containing protein [Tritrichomonas foetus]|uniref:NADPH--hemoprotein reductase n=1 Tax=Tritrichomonas foetus TaxID=1144522 RepID=A0A1J4K3X0_9EUKA|nr:Iron only hydrogenase large subunit, C-terminal domain containing protein [Tritrichomonas foetus]|eukprot:OHT04390.1 Iron only hydrogenase large subunit, C-terminal domain containing protein [Tritrichomonas foetus]